MVSTQLLDVLAFTFFFSALEYFIGILLIRPSKGRLIHFGPQISRQSPPPIPQRLTAAHMGSCRRDVKFLGSVQHQMEDILCVSRIQSPRVEGTLLSTSCPSLLLQWQEPLPGHTSHPNSTSPRELQTLGLQSPG